MQHFSSRTPHAARTDAFHLLFGIPFYRISIGCNVNGSIRELSWISARECAIPAAPADAHPALYYINCARPHLRNSEVRVFAPPVSALIACSYTVYTVYNPGHTRVHVRRVISRSQTRTRFAYCLSHGTAAIRWNTAEIRP